MRCNLRLLDGETGFMYERISFKSVSRPGRITAPGFIVGASKRKGVMAATLRRCGPDDSWATHGQRAGIICRFNLQLRNHCKFPVVYNERRIALSLVVGRAVACRLRQTNPRRCKLRPFPWPNEPKPVHQQQPAYRYKRHPGAVARRLVVFAGRPAGIAQAQSEPLAPGAGHLHGQIVAEY